MRKKWLDEELKEAVRSSQTFIEVYRKLGLVGNRHLSVINRMKELQICHPHFSIKSKRTGPQVKILLEDIFSGVKSTGSSDLKKRLLKAKLLEYKCAGLDCGISEWRNKKLTLQLDHIDGNNKNNALTNLRLLCPNCHSQTATYCNGKHKRRMEITYKYNCKTCGSKISVGCIFCRKCAPTLKVDRDWPSKETLQNMLTSKGPLSTARELGVSRHMLYCHTKKLGL